MEIPHDMRYILEQRLRTELEAAQFKNRPFYMLGARIYRDGNKWCALLGEDIQTGVVGFGDNPEDAALAFDLAWWRGEQS